MTRGGVGGVWGEWVLGFTNSGGTWRVLVVVVWVVMGKKGVGSLGQGLGGWGEIPTCLRVVVGAGLV